MFPSTLRAALAFAAVSLSLSLSLSVGAHAATPSAAADASATVNVNGRASYGGAAPTGTADYKLVVTPEKKWLNVNNGDTVEFDVGSKEFTWHFDTLHDHVALPLSTIAPAGFDAGAARIFVGRDPRTLN